jgi:murein DD-endopeptidase MepM/ murein hydrolase activator NlpD
MRRLLAAVASLIVVAVTAVVADFTLRPGDVAEPTVAGAPSAAAFGVEVPANILRFEFPEFAAVDATPLPDSDAAATPPSDFEPAELAPVATPEPEPVAVAVAEPLAIPATFRTGTTIISQGELMRGDSLAAAMSRSNVPANVVHLVASETSKVYDFRRAQPGHRFHLTQDLDGRVLDFQYHLSSIESIQLKLENGVYVARRADAELVPKVSRIAGVVNSSLYGAMLDLGEEPQLANDFTNVFAWAVDFSRTVQHGDEFRVVYERLYYTDDAGTDVYAGPGRILAARYGGAVGEHTAVYFETEEGRGGYYRPDGTSMERQFLLAPLAYSRVSSRYTSARAHPILKITRPHHGIDYAAERGSPVWSVADGEVIYRARAGGFGNLVKVRHTDGYVSYYSHLQGFSKGLRVGDRVQQKQVIGYVGSTGLATGPHVCFRIAKDGRYVNPAQVQSPAATPIPPEAREEFAAVRDSLLSQLNRGPFVETAEAL